jgi:hypothetical protein
MDNLHKIIKSIFYNIIEYKEFKVLEKNDNSILFFNNNCYLFIGQHMGETYVYISKEKNDNPIQPLMWAIINKKMNYRKVLPLNYSPEIKMEDLVKYRFCNEKILISLYCDELLDGDFSNLPIYKDNLKKQSAELYNYYNDRYYNMK